ncbi:MAG: hypothetical protein AMJ94_03930 [Deltaproteobacteria bacterium SM23_61]|nr:MAG: hypothetical protein AMJ94_03930 [Deltaproteobacteria bacterium SM23_61]
MWVPLTRLRIGQVYRVSVFYRFPNDAFAANDNSFCWIIISANPAANFQIFSLHKGTPGAFSQSLVYMFQTILDEIIPFRAPTHQMGHFEKISISLYRI